MVRRGLLAVSLEEAAETIIQTMGDSLLVLDPSGVIVLSNDAAEMRVLVARDIRALRQVMSDLSEVNDSSSARP